MRRGSKIKHPWNMPNELYQSQTVRRANVEGYKRCLKELDA
jgi:hypothetical protein